MCRSIKVLRRSDGAPTDEELYLAARQFVRKVSGYPKPSKSNEAIFEDTIVKIAATARHMFDHLVEARPPRRSEGQDAEAPPPAKPRTPRPRPARTQPA